MKKFLTFMMILITVMGMGFAEAPAAGIPAAQAQATLEFTFTWSDANGLAKNYAGFYNAALIGQNSIEKLEDLAGKTVITGPIAIDKTSKTWAPGTVVYATAGTNWIPTVTKVTLTLNPLKAVGANDLGYTVDCSVVTGRDNTSLKKTGSESQFTGGNIAVAGGTPEGTPVVISADIQAKLKNPPPAAHPNAIQQLDGTNGILELMFENMTVTGADHTEVNPYAPTYGVGQEDIKNYKATWTFSIKAQ